MANVTVSPDRKSLTVDGRTLVIHLWPENNVALTDEGGYYTAGPHNGEHAEPCDDCGEVFPTRTGSYTDDGSLCANCASDVLAGIEAGT